jgi:hypothetical protein
MVESVQPSFEGGGGLVQAYPSQNQSAESEHHILAAPTPTLVQGFNPEPRVAGLGYADPPGLDYLQPPLRASSEAAISSREPAYHVRSLPPQDTNALGLWSGGREANQEEIWSNFMVHLGLQNVEPRA